MTDHEKRIREALEAGPTEGPWAVLEHSWSDTSIVAPGFDHGVCCLDINHATEESEETDEALMAANAAFIAACNPSAIRALLADLDRLRDNLDAMRGALKRLKTAVNYKAACLVANESVDKVAFADDQVWKAVDEADAALKGASA